MEIKFSEKENIELIEKISDSLDYQKLSEKVTDNLKDEIKDEILEEVTRLCSTDGQFVKSIAENINYSEMADELAYSELASNIANEMDYYSLATELAGELNYIKLAKSIYAQEDELFKSLVSGAIKEIIASRPITNEVLDEIEKPMLQFLELLKVKLGIPEDRLEEEAIKWVARLVKR